MHIVEAHRGPYLSRREYMVDRLTNPRAFCDREADARICHRFHIVGKVMSVLDACHDA